MIKWEYARLESTDGGVSVVFSHRQPWPGLAADAFFETLRRLGDDGWELVSALPLSAVAELDAPTTREPRPGSPALQEMRLRLDTARWLVFKRPQPAEPEGKSGQTDLVKGLVERQILKGKLPF